MARKCTCQLCKTVGTTDTFYKVTDEKRRNKYYCNKEEYENHINEKFKREELLKFIAEEVFEYEDGQIVHPIMIKKIGQLNKFYDYEVIWECFKVNKDNIQYWIKTKNFDSEFGMVSYVMKIIEGSINDIHKNWKYKKRQEQYDNSSGVDLEILNINSKINNERSDNGILEFLDEEDI